MFQRFIHIKICKYAGDTHWAEREDCCGAGWKKWWENRSTTRAWREPREIKERTKFLFHSVVVGRLAKQLCFVERKRSVRRTSLGGNGKVFFQCYFFHTFFLWLLWVSYWVRWNVGWFHFGIKWEGRKGRRFFGDSINFLNFFFASSFIHFTHFAEASIRAPPKNYVPSCCLLSLGKIFHGYLLSKRYLKHRNLIIEVNFGLFWIPTTASSQHDGAESSECECKHQQEKKESGPEHGPKFE